MHDTAWAKAFGAALAAPPRSLWASTAISARIDHVMQLLVRSRMVATRRVIHARDDGTNNAGQDVTGARDDTLTAGITINGLTTIKGHPVSWIYAYVQPPRGLPNHDRHNVTGGPGSFVLEVHDVQSFGKAMRRTLISEIAARTPKRYDAWP
jgi:hypothetical protein